MTLKSYSDGSILYAQTLNEDNAASLRAAGLNTVRQLIDRDVDFSAGTTDCFADAYVSSGGREGTVSTTNTTATFSTNKYQAANITATDYLILNATAIQGNWSINDCTLTRLDTTKWILSCSTGTTDVRRAKLYNTLRTNYYLITGLTAVKTPTVADQNKYLTVLWTRISSDNSLSGTIEISTRYTCSSDSIDYWYFIETGNRYNNVSTQSGAEIRRNGVAIHTVNRNNGSSTYSSSGNLNTAPSTQTTVTQMDAWARIIDSDGSGFVDPLDSVLITVGSQQTSVSTVVTSNPGFGYTTFTYTIQLTAASASDLVSSNVVVHTLPTGRLSSTSSSCVGVPFLSDYETGADVQYAFGGLSSTIGTNFGISSNIGLRDASARTKIAQSFSTTYTQSISHIWLMLRAIGSPSGTVTIRIETDSAGSPSGSLVNANATASVSTSNIFPDFNQSNSFFSNISFSGSFTLTKATTYWIVLEGSYSVSGSNYVDTYTSTYAGGESKSFDGTNWSSNGTDISFVLGFENYTTTTSFYPAISSPIQNFSAWTAQPDALIIKLIPKSSSPTAGFPSIRGFTLFAE